MEKNKNEISFIVVDDAISKIKGANAASWEGSQFNARNTDGD